MGESALKSHGKSQKHKKHLELKQIIGKQPTLTSFLGTTSKEGRQ